MNDRKARKQAEKTLQDLFQQKMLLSMMQERIHRQEKMPEILSITLFGKSGSSSRQIESRYTDGIRKKAGLW